MRKLKWILAAPVWIASAMSVSVTSSTNSPAPVGTLIRFTANVTGADPGALSYRFRVRLDQPRITRRHAAGEDFGTVVDFGPSPTFDWTTIERAGFYQIEASVKNAVTGEIASDMAGFVFEDLVTGDSPVIAQTAHPLVFIYSAPPCPSEARIRVTFTPADGGAAQSTPFRDCDGRTAMNFYLAGLRPATAYTARQTIEGRGLSADGVEIPFSTPAVDFQLPPSAPLSTPVPAQAGILLHGVINAAPFATDLNGNLLWYGPAALTFFTRAAAGGRFLGLIEDGSQDTAHQIFREFDVAGVTLAETNARRVNEQLVALGVAPITSFHHEAIRLENGNYLLLAGTERILTDVQGAGPVDVLGDVILVLDRDLQVAWTWDAFDHLDPRRAAVLNETCAFPATVACSAFYQAKSANDWLHGNALAMTPDGDILYSIRHQDWIVKIDYRNGAGSGDILWRMGVGGDFRIDSIDPYPWFSHQHDPHFLADNRTLLVFDNGNTRIARNGGNSRGQAFRVDEATRTVTPILNADLKQNSSALGTIEQLPGGDYHYDLGFIVDPANPAGRITQALESDASGNIVWAMQIAAQEYRSFRMTDLYTPPGP